MLIKRDIEDTIIKCSKEFACITIYGARQVGKSTVLEMIFKDKYNIVTLDDTLNLDLAKKNPKLFLETYHWPLIIDEIQKAPELLPEIKILIDKQKFYWNSNNLPYELMFILTGSNQFDLQQAVSESLAGRTAILNLASLSYNEIRKSNNHNAFNPNINILKQKEKDFKPPYRTRKEIFNDIFKGGMPEYIVNNKDRDLFFSSYIKTYIEKDVRRLLSADNETTFLNFLSYIALRTACQVNYSDISNAIGIDVRTVKKWISILCTSGIIILLDPYMKNASDRIVKTSKLYFMDTGLCAYLCKWPNSEMLENGVMNGAFYETYVVSEIIKSYYNSNQQMNLNLYYYRDRDQKEVDLIIESIEGIYPIEIKKGINPVNSKKNFDVLKKYGKNIMTGLVIDSCEKIFPINEKVYYCPISLIGL